MIASIRSRTSVEYAISRTGMLARSAATDGHTDCKTAPPRLLPSRRRAACLRRQIKAICINNPEAVPHRGIMSSYHGGRGPGGQISKRLVAAVHPLDVSEEA